VRIALNAAGRSRSAISAAGVRTPTKAVRARDRDALIAVGEILVFPGAKPMFHVPETAGLLDFVAIHVDPKRGQLERATAAIEAYDVGKPIVVEEIFPLECGVEELEARMRTRREAVAGWIGFYWGATPEEYAAMPPSIAGALARVWLELVRRLTPEFRLPCDDGSKR